MKTQVYLCWFFFIFSAQTLSTLFTHRGSPADTSGWLLQRKAGNLEPQFSKDSLCSTMVTQWTLVPSTLAPKVSEWQWPPADASLWVLEHPLFPAHTSVLSVIKILYLRSPYFPHHNHSWLIQIVKPVSTCQNSSSPQTLYRILTYKKVPVSQLDPLDSPLLSQVERKCRQLSDVSSEPAFSTCAPLSWVYCPSGSQTSVNIADMKWSSTGGTVLSCLGSSYAW